MARDPRDDWGEYSGKPGAPHLAKDGHEELTPQEGARILRTHAIQSPDVPAGGPPAPNQGIDPATGEPWVDEQQAYRLAQYGLTLAKVNGYKPEDVK
jgi:hypothetical protein